MIILKRDKLGKFVKKYAVEKREKTNHFSFYLQDKEANLSYFIEYMNSIRPETITLHFKLICDWSVKIRYLVYSRVSKVLLKNRVVSNRVSRVFSCQQKQWLEIYIYFSTKREQQQKIFSSKILRSF